MTLELPSSALFAAVKESTAVYPMCREDGNPLGEIPAGEEVEILLIGDNWCKVDYQNGQGYCLTKKLSVNE